MLSLIKIQQQSYLHAHAYTQLCTFMSVATHGINAHTINGELALPIYLCLSIKTTLHVVILFYSTKSKISSA
jgi:uncharacterized protein with PQ loop repeat